MKKRVRVYKAENGQGQYYNQMGQFLKRAQMGMEQQSQQPNMQQVVMQVAGLIMPPPEGQGQDPQQIYQSLVQSYGEEAAAQIINAAVSMAQPQETATTQETIVEEPLPVDDLTMQEQLIQEEEERQQQERDDQYVIEDEEFMNDLLYGDDEEEQPEAKYGGAQHRKFVKKSLKLAKKQLGDAGNSQGKNTADIYDGALKRSEDFTTNLKNEATLSLLEKQFKNMSQAAPQMQAQSHFAYGGSQFGGMTGYGLDRFIYGGYDPSVPELTKAQYGYQFNQLLENLNTDKRGITSFSRGADMAQKAEDAEDPDNKELYEHLKAIGVNVGEYREGMNYQEVADKLKGSKGSGSKTNYNYQPYSTDNIWDALIPNNTIFGKKYTMSGPMDYLGRPFKGAFNPMNMKGFNVEKERLGFGHKRYTFTPTTGAATKNDLNKDKLNKPGYFKKEAESGYSRAYYDRQKMKESLGNFGDKLQGFMNRAFTKPEKRAEYGLQTYQGNINGSSVNNQEPPIEFKPRTAKEVWDKYEPELRKQWGSKIGQDEQLEYGDPRIQVDEERYFNGTNFLNMANPLLKSIPNLFTRDEKKNFFGYKNDTSDDLNMAQAQRFRGNYNPNSGLFRENLEGQNWQSKYGGVPHMKIGGPKGRTGQQVDYSLGIFPTALGGSDINQYIGRKKPEIVDTLKPVPRDEANLEAEKGETAYGDLNGDGFPEHYEIGGKRHYEGGTPLNLPDDTFIFSDTRSMRINDPKILKMFNRKPKKGGYTPAELAKQYDINEYRKILDDPDSDVVDRKTAEQMIKNFNIKLGALALAQESKKGFPQGIPVAAQPYMQAMGIKEEDIIPKEEETQQMAQQVMSQQGMAPQGTMPEEQMAMASQEGMMASPEEMGMSPEAMMRYGGMRRLRRAQEGMAQGQPSPEEMAMMQQQGGSDEMQQMLQQVQQALQQGAQPEEVAAQLIQSQIQPEAVMQIFMQLGVPQEEAAGIVQSVMQQMQGAQQQAPMAAYGMEIGGYDMPFAQDGYGVPGGFNSPITPEDFTDMQRTSDRTMGAQQFYADDNVVPFQGEDAYLPSYFPPNLLNKYGEPKMGARVTNMPMTRGEGVTSGESQMGYNIGDPFYGSSRNFKDTLYDFTHPGEFKKRKQYGIYNDVDKYNTGVNEFAYGGSLDRYQTKGEVKQRIYTEDQLPEDARIVEKYTRGKKPGDFELQEDGTYRKVTKYDLKPSASSATKQQTAAEFAAQSEENKKLLEQANAIIAREIGNRTIKGDKDGGPIELTGNLSLPFNERIILSKALNSNKDFGTDKYKVTKQSATTGYSKKDASGKLTGTGSFVAGFTPEDYEKRYLYEQLKGMGADDETAFAEIEKIYNDPTQKASVRREYLNFLGIAAPADDAELLDANFYKTRYKDVTTAMERLDEGTFRTPEAGGNDLISGFDHFDAMGFQYNPEYEAEQQQEQDQEETTDETEDVNVPVPQYAPWWLQDTIKTAGAFGDLMDVNKYYPWAPKYNPMMPEPTFLDPTRSIAAQSEQARILGDTMAKLSPSSSLAASRLSGLQGELAKGASDTANQYDKANVEIANQFAGLQADVANKAQEYNLGVSKGLYDANTIMNQQYDNTKRALRGNLLNQYTNAITNRWKTDALNQLYPQYAVDPSIGGRLNFVKGKEQDPTLAKKYGDYYDEAFEATGDADAAAKYALLAWKQSQGMNVNDPSEAIMSHYANMANGGVFVMGPSLLPPMIL